MELSERYLNDQREAGMAFRTNHAGACAVTALYAGQAALAAWRARGECAAIAADRDRERQRAAVYAAQLRERGVPSSRLRLPATAAAYALGLVTALAGARSVVGVRQEVDRLARHELQRQIERLRGRDHVATELLIGLLADRGRVATEAAASPSGAWLRAVRGLLGAGVTLLRRTGRSG